MTEELLQKYKYHVGKIRELNRLLKDFKKGEKRELENTNSGEENES